MPAISSETSSPLNNLPKTNNSTTPKKTDWVSSFTSSVAAAQLENALFYMPDTIDKRLQTSHKKIFNAGLSYAEMFKTFKETAFKNETESVYSMLRSAYRGFGIAALYKIPQRGIKFGLQPPLYEELQKKYGLQAQKKFGDKGKDVLSATASGAVGVMESALIPMDRFKIWIQVNGGKLSPYQAFQILRDHPYKGLTPTLLRNVPSTISLFYFSSKTKQYVFGLTPDDKASFAQNFFSALTGAFVAVPISNPADVVRTRVMSSNQSSMEVFLNLMKKEGVSALGKGTLTRMMSAIPRIAFTMGAMETLFQKFKQNKQPEKHDQSRKEADLASKPPLLRG